MPEEARLENHYIKVRQLIEDYRGGRLVIPEFQREYVWNPVEPAELLAYLVALAGEAGIRVRAAAGAEAALESGLCRVRGELWLVLVPADPLEHRIGVVVGRSGSTRRRSSRSAGCRLR